MVNLNKLQRQNLLVKEGIHTKEKNEWAKQLNVSEKTIDRDFKDIIKRDISRINRENVIHKSLHQYDKIEEECLQLSNNAISIRDKINILRLKLEVLQQRIQLLQEGGVIEKAPEKVDLTLKERYEGWFKKKPILIRNEDLK